MNFDLSQSTTTLETVVVIPNAFEKDLETHLSIQKLFSEEISTNPEVKEDKNGGPTLGQATGNE